MHDVQKSYNKICVTLKENKSHTFLLNQDIYIMGRKLKLEIEKKIKISISLDRKLYNLIKESNDKPSQVLEKLLKEYYDDKNL